MAQDHPSEEQLIALAKADPEAIGKLCFELFKRVAALQAKVESLEAKVAELERNSRISSKPPSSDSGNFTNPPKPKSLRFSGSVLRVQRVSPAFSGSEF